jgi:hypothetical protein
MEDTQMAAKVHVRGTSMQLAAYTRALELCARMNRETEVLDFIDSVPLGGCLYDLGACEGRFALYAALRSIRCYAFEPESMNFAAMLRNIDLNGDKAKAFLTPLNLLLWEIERKALLLRLDSLGPAVIKRLLTANQAAWILHSILSANKQSRWLLWMSSFPAQVRPP